MRGADTLNETACTVHHLDDFVPRHHPLRAIRQMVNKALVKMDKASVHKAKTIAPLLELLECQGLKLYFLPPYSPKLNHIEKLWHKMKYEWMIFKARDAKTLQADVEEILAGFGDKYTLSFY